MIATDVLEISREACEKGRIAKSQEVGHWVMILALTVAAGYLAPRVAGGAAVAFSYEPGSSGAPKVIAKSTDSLALRIRERAEERDVPAVENPPPARALREGVELDQEIPPEHDWAAGEIIGYVMHLTDRLPARRIH